jgi:Tol biopolymer transport system component
MRSPRLLAYVLGSVVALTAGTACRGDDDGGTSVDARRIDARVIDAPTIDASTIDAPIDAPGASGTTVWVFGDLVTNNVQQLGTFTHPVATPPATLTFVHSAGELPFTNFPVPFSIAADGSRIAYVSRALAADPWKLSYAAADGTGVVDVFMAPLGRSITDVSLSPDKTKIAFRADLELATMFDVYVVPATVGATPVKISPDRTVPAPTLGALGHLSWSRDSRYLAFGGDFTTDNLNEVRIRDTQANTTATALPASEIMATTNPRGLLSAPQWTAAGKLVFNARNTVAGERRLYSANADGTGLAVLANTLITRADDTLAEASSFGLSPDGLTIAFAADGVIATAFELYAMPATGAAAPTRLTGGDVPAGRGLDLNRPPRFNPAGTAIAFGADYGATDDKFEPYVAPIAPGPGPHRLAVIGPAADASRDVQNLAWTGDGAFIYAIADGGALDNDPFALYALDTTLTDQPLTPILTPPASGDAFEVVTRF